MITFAEAAARGASVSGTIAGRAVASLELLADGQVCVWLADGFLILSGATPFDLAGV